MINLYLYTIESRTEIVHDDSLSFSAFQATLCKSKQQLSYLFLESEATFLYILDILILLEKI